MKEFHCVTVYNQEHTKALKAWLRDNGFYFEPSGCFSGVHFEIACNFEQFQQIDNLLTIWEGM